MHGLCALRNRLRLRPPSLHLLRLRRMLRRQRPHRLPRLPHPQRPHLLHYLPPPPPCSGRRLPILLVARRMRSRGDFWIRLTPTALPLPRFPRQSSLSRHRRHRPSLPLLSGTSLEWAWARRPCPSARLYSNSRLVSCPVLARGDLLRPSLRIRACYSRSSPRALASTGSFLHVLRATRRHPSSRSRLSRTRRRSRRVPSRTRRASTRSRCSRRPPVSR